MLPLSLVLKAVKVDVLVSANSATGLVTVEKSAGSWERGMSSEHARRAAVLPSVLPEPDLVGGPGLCPLRGPRGRSLAPLASTVQHAGDEASRLTVERCLSNEGIWGAAGVETPKSRGLPL